jgi:glucose-6-phosphate 1-epimerase
MSDAPHLDLRAPDGAFARVYVDGAQVAQWVPAGSADDRLFVSASAHHGPGVSIRGGIPLCFPQFGPFGALPQHGFARTSRWRVTDDLRLDEGLVMLSLTERDLTPATAELARHAWPHPFAADLHVAVGGDTLAVTLVVTNTGDTPFAFTAALHPYFAVRDAFACTVTGLTGLTYRDALAGGAELSETAPELAITGPLDRIYYSAPDVLDVREPHRALRIEKHGFSDAVVWNPGPTGTSSRADFTPGDEQHMLCVEAAVVRTPIALEPGQHWVGTQRMTAR